MKHQSNLKKLFLVMALIIRTSICCMANNDASHRCATNSIIKAKYDSIPSLSNESYPGAANRKLHRITVTRMKHEKSINTVN